MLSPLDEEPFFPPVVFVLVEIVLMLSACLFLLHVYTVNTVECKDHESSHLSKKKLYFLIIINAHINMFCKKASVFIAISLYSLYKLERNIVSPGPGCDP